MQMKKFKNRFKKTPQRTRKIIYRERVQYGWYVGIEDSESPNGYSVGVNTGFSKEFGGRHNTNEITLKRFICLWLYQAAMYYFDKNRYNSFDSYYPNMGHSKVYNLINKVFPK